VSPRYIEAIGIDPTATAAPYLLLDREAGTLTEITREELQALKHAEDHRRMPDWPVTLPPLDGWDVGPPAAARELKAAIAAHEATLPPPAPAWHPPAWTKPPKPNHAARKAARKRQRLARRGQRR
jgi:hypothetical protein